MNRVKNEESLDQDQSEAKNVYIPFVPFNCDGRQWRHESSIQRTSPIPCHRSPGNQILRNHGQDFRAQEQTGTRYRRTLP